MLLGLEMIFIKFWHEGDRKYEFQFPERHTLDNYAITNLSGWMDLAEWYKTYKEPVHYTFTRQVGLKTD